MSNLTIFGLCHFEAAQRWREQKCHALPKTCSAYPAMMKRGTFIPYLIRIQKKHTSLTRPLISADISIFSPEMSNFSYIKNTHIDCIDYLIHEYIEQKWTEKLRPEKFLV